MTLVEHANEFMTNSLIVVPVLPESWALGIHSVLCWQCVHIILGTHIYNISHTEGNAFMWFPQAFQVQFLEFQHLFYPFSWGLQGVPVSN